MVFILPVNGALDPNPLSDLAAVCREVMSLLMLVLLSNNNFCSCRIPWASHSKSFALLLLLLSSLSLLLCVFPLHHYKNLWGWPVLIPFKRRPLRSSKEMELTESPTAGKCWCWGLNLGGLVSRVSQLRLCAKPCTPCFLVYLAGPWNLALAAFLGQAEGEVGRHDGCYCYC